MPVQARASLWYLISSVLQKGISVISTPIFTRLLTKEEYGLFGVFNSWLSIFAVFVTLRLYYGVYSQALVKYDDDRDGFTSSMVGLTCTLSAGWLAIYLLFSDVINPLVGLSTSQMLAMFMSIWAEAIFCFWAARQRVEYTYQKLIAYTIGVSIAKPLLGVIAVLVFPDKVSARIWELAIVELVAYAGLFYTQVRGGPFYSARVWRYALAFNIPLIPHYLSQTILNSSDRIMIERFIGLGPAGIYTLAVSIAHLMTLFNSAISQTISPWIYQKIKDNRSQDIGRVVYPSVLFVAALNLVLIALAPEAVWLFAPKSYHEAIWAIPPVSMSVFFIHIYNVYSAFEFYFERPGFIAVSTAMAAVINVVLNLIFMPRFGYLTAAYTTLFSYIAYACFHALFARRICLDNIGQNPLSWKALMLYSTLFMGAGAILTASYNHSVLRWSLIIIACIAALIKRRDIHAYIKGLLSRKKS